jgi:hypothetical protein
MYTEYYLPIVTLKTMDTVNCFISVHTSFQFLMIAEKSNEYLGTKHLVYWFAWGCSTAQSSLALFGWNPATANGLGGNGFYGLGAGLGFVWMG